MSVDRNKLLVRRFLQEVFNTGDVAEIENFISADYTEVYEGKRYKLGTAGAREHVLGVRRAFPDLIITVEHQIGEGDWVASSITVRGTHKGDWLGMKPTQRAVTFTGVNINKVCNNRIVEHGGAANLLGPLLETGAVHIASPTEPADQPVE